jgi:para-aminobenzoate synthetase component 1
MDTVLARLASRRGLVSLDSAAGAPRRFSLVAFDPVCGVGELRALPDLRELVHSLERASGDDVPGPFHGGFVGALSYDLGAAGERAARVGVDPWNSPRFVGGLYTDFLVRDERTRESWLVLGDAPGDGRAPVAARRRDIESLLANEDASRASPRPEGPLVRHTSAGEHIARIDDVRRRISEGDLYQANIAHRFTRAMSGSPVDLYRRLRVVNAAPYMAYLAWDEELRSPASSFAPGALLSASPELLFEFDGERVSTRPIKGTAPRGRDPSEDASNARALLASEKDRAELAMIVDLARNDLGRVAVTGSVAVDAFPRLETYASVHHLVADVSARVRDTADAIDILGALFPGGSITGAPKLAAIDVIGAIERAGRGFFTGSLGFIDTRGHAAFNILIRTIVWRPRGDASAQQGEVSFHVGGGITWPSDARAEEQETLVKGAALAAALEPASESASTPFR